MKIGIHFTVAGLAAITWAQPAIRNTNGVLNANGYQPQLAPDTVFVIIGTNPGPATIATAFAPNYPPQLGGTSVIFTPAGGSPIKPNLVYSLSTAVAGVLPSSIAPGTYAVTVNYQGQSSQPQNVSVVPRSLGIATASGTGSGAAQATIANVNNGLSLVRMTSGNVSFG